MFKSFWEIIAKTNVEPRLFSMTRNSDESGTSGTGKVLDGIVFPNGKTVICWNTKDNPDSKVDVGSISVFDSWENFHQIHVGQHPTNGTEFIWKSRQDWLSMTDNLIEILNQTNLTISEKNRILNMLLTYSRVKPGTVSIYSQEHENS